MNTLLEVNPSSCVFVVGPRLTSCCHRRDGGTTGRRPSNYLEVVESGISAVQRLGRFASEEERAEAWRRLRGAYGRDPELAAREAVESLRRGGSYESWLRETFDCRGGKCPSTHPPVEHLIAMQQQGAMLACTQYDTALDELAGTEPVCLADNTGFGQWLEKGLGILHLCGVYSRPESVCLDGASLRNNLANFHPQSLAALVELFRKRLVVFVGYGSDEVSPLVLQLVKATFPDEASLKNPPLILTCCEGEGLTADVRIGKELRCQAFPGFLLLEVSQKETVHLEQVISAGPEKNFSIGELIA